MKKRIITLLLAALLIFALLPACALADTGPKPCVSINFYNIDEPYFVTLLSEAESTGPWSAGSPYEDYMGDRAVYEKFSAYEDPDGFYFLGEYDECTDTDNFLWSYYPPETFKILIYFPESDSFTAVPGVYERYAFDSFYGVDGETLSVEKKPELAQLTWEALLRVVLTLAIELAVALLFCFRSGKQIKIIILTNIATQILLNVALNVVYFKSGPWATLAAYVPLEIAIFAIEAFVYSKLLPKHMESEKKPRPVLYAFAANALSFILGGVILALF